METIYFLFQWGFSSSGSPPPPPPPAPCPTCPCPNPPIALQLSMTYPYVGAASLVPILEAIQTQIVTVTGLSAEKVSLSAKEIQPRFKGDQDVYIRLMDSTPDMGFEHGSGRTCIIVRRPLVVTLRTRYQVDPSDIQNAWFLDSHYGHIAKEECLFNGLVNWIPLDSSGNWLTSEPLHPMPTPPEVMMEKPKGKGWGESHMTFELVYQAVTNPAY